MANSEGDQIPVSAECKSTTKESKEAAGDLKAKLHNSTGDHSKLGENNRVDSKSQNGVANHVESKSHHSSDKHKDSSHRHKDHKSSDSKHHHSSSSSSSKSKDHHHSSSNHKEGGSSSSHKSKESGSKHHSSSGSSSKHNSSSSHSSDKSKHHHSSSSKHSSSSGHGSEKHREKDGHSSDKHRTKDGHSSSDKHNEKDGHSSSDKHKEKDGHSSDKHRDKNGHRSDKHREKDGHSSASGDKHREHSKHKERSAKESSKGKEHSSSKKEHQNDVSVKKESIDTVTVKKEIDSKVKLTNDLHSPKHVKNEDEDFASLKKLKVSPTKIKSEPESDDDVPLSSRMHDVSNLKRPIDSEDDEPLTSRAQKVKKIKKEEPKKAKKRKADGSDENEFEIKKKKKDIKGTKVKTETSPTKRGKKKEAVPAPETWKWWEEERKDDGTKWKFLEHKGPVFAPDYDPLPGDVKFKYDGKELKLSLESEEVAGFFAKMLEHDYTTREVFRKNFFKDWRKVMTKEEKETITDINKCNFKQMHAYFTQQSEQRKNRTKEDKLALKKSNEEIQAEYGYCNMDGHTEKIGNFRIEPPGLFRGRGDHPKQGMLKTRTSARDVTINCHKDAVIPDPPKGQKWKKVQHDNTVSWLATWTENVQGQNKYVMLNPASRLKGEKDWNKYEVARKLAKYVDKIRAQYREDWKSKEMRIRQRAVALYFIDKLALRAGNEKDEGESADTVGCCSLRVEHLTLHENMDGKDFVVEFDFLGKDSIRYQNSVTVEKRVFKNLEMFSGNKQPGDDIFDRLNTAILNKHLHDLMEGLTAKVFRTYNASKTLQEQLDLLTTDDDNIPAKILSYNRANRAVAILCNHQRAVPKNFSKQMENMQVKIDAKKDAIKDAKRAVKDAKSTLKAQKTETAKMLHEKRKKILARLEEQLIKLEVTATDKDENKDIALGTSKLNYLDPRISVAWCKKWEVPIEKIYNKTQREKFQWAIDMATSEYTF